MCNATQAGVLTTTKAMDRVSPDPSPLLDEQILIISKITDYPAN